MVEVITVDIVSKIKDLKARIIYCIDYIISLQALERLHVNQILNSKCIELLESTLTILKAAGEKYSLHAILFVNCKLLSLYSR